MVGEDKSAPEEETDSRYKSIGTIQVRTSRNDENEQERHIHFTPNSDYLAKHKGKSYALFFQDGGKCIPKKMRRKGGGIKIKADLMNFPDLVAAATSQSLVEVEVKKVKVDYQESLELSGVKVPADRKMQ